MIAVANTSNSSSNLRLFHDDSGGDPATFDETTALYYDVPIDGNKTLLISAEDTGTGITLSRSGALGGYSSVDLALTVTVYGNSEDIAPGHMIRHK